VRRPRYGARVAFLAVVASVVLLIGAATGGTGRPMPAHLKLTGPAPTVRPARAATPELRAAQFLDGPSVPNPRRASR
jgi:hypothetical protein